MMKDVPVTGEDYVELYMKSKAANDTVAGVLAEINTSKAQLSETESKLTLQSTLNDKLISDINIKDKKLTELSNRLNKVLTKTTASEFFKGEWKIRYRLNPGNDYESEFFTVNSNNIWLNITTHVSGKIEYTDYFHIDLFNYDEEYGTLQYFKYDVSGDASNWRIGSLNFVKDKNNWEGIERYNKGVYQVIIERIK